MSDRTEAIDKKRRDWITAVNAGDMEGYLSILAADIVWFPPGRPAVTGKEEFRQWVEPFFARFQYDFRLSGIKTEIRDDWAIERGVFTSDLTSKKDGEMMRHTGRYLVFWRRSKRDVWEIERYLDISAD